MNIEDRWSLNIGLINMKCGEGKSKLWSHNISYCLIEVVTKAGPTVFPPSIYSYLADMIVHPVLTTAI